jgi:outer membrane protein OmpA-like peptidoglycan-associated protein
MRGYGVLGYPYRMQVVFLTLLMIGLALGVAPLAKTTAWMVASLVAVVGMLSVVWRSLSLRRASVQHAAALSALATATSRLSLRLRTRMPLVLVIGDHLDQIFDRSGSIGGIVHVGEGAIWLRADHLQDLPHLAAAVCQWRDGRAPDGIVLMLSPTSHTETGALAQALRLARQAASDTSRLLGKCLPGYLAVYQRVTDGHADSPTWFGISSARPMRDASRFDAVSQLMDVDVVHSDGERLKAWRAAGLSGVLDWTREAVLPLLLDRREAAAAWPLYGVAWIDAGASVQGDASSMWRSALQGRTGVGVPSCSATAAPWPLPQPLIEAMPQRAWMSPRWRALAHALCLLALAVGAAFWSAAYNNRTLMAQTSELLERFASIPASRDETRRAALNALMNARDRLDRYRRVGVPMRLDFGLYHGAAIVPALDKAIASYQPPPAPPTIFTLDSLSLFDTGQATLKPGSTRMLVNALEAIKAHPHGRILVAGHTDNVGGTEINMQLSMARAVAVRDWLMDAADVPATRFAIQGYGATHPVANNDSVDGRARNRRVEITLIPDSPGG